VKAATYCNPLLAPLNIGDPFVLRHDGKYYLYGTTDPDYGFRVFVSDDLVHWSERGFALQNHPESWGSPPFWAPEVLSHRGRFFMTYSARDLDSGRLLTALAVADDPAGPFRNLAAPWFDFGFSAIDTHLLVDNDKVFAFFSRNGEQDGYSFGIIYGVPVAPDLAMVAGEPLLLMQADQEWEKINYAFNRANEGPFVFKRGTTYYMTYSANHTFRYGYGIGYATAATPLGPWTKSADNPIASSDLGVGYSGAGHCSLALSPDELELFMVYHTHADLHEPANERRQLNIDRINLDEDGRLFVVGPTRVPQRVPSGTPSPTVRQRSR
jgi:beta-xylosidase